MKQLLFIAHRVPFPPNKGERVRAFHEIKALSEYFHVTVAALAHNREDVIAANELKNFCQDVFIVSVSNTAKLLRAGFYQLIGKSATEGYFFSRRFREMIISEARHRQFDIVMCYSSSMMPYGLTVPAVARIIDLVDVDSAKWSSYADSSRWPMSWLYRRESHAVRRMEEEAIAKYDAALLVSQNEVEALGLSDGKIQVMANGVDIDFFRPDIVAPIDIESPNLVFTGTMDYRPNVEGVCWFVSSVWPELKRREPSLTFTIVGRNPVKAVRQLSQVPGVTVTGFVPDVRPYLAAASIVIAPLKIARGIQNKILEAMAMGKAIVASPAALEGLEIQRGSDVLQADAPDEWCEHSTRLLSNESLRIQFGKTARATVERKYRWSAQMQTLVSLCRRLIEDTPTLAGNSKAFQNASTVLSGDKTLR